MLMALQSPIKKGEIVSMDYVDMFKKELLRLGKSINTIESYITDIRIYIKWFEETYGKRFDNKILIIDIKSYQSFLLNVKKLKLSTIHRKICSLNKYNQYLVSVGISNELENINRIIIRSSDSNDRQIKTISKLELNKLKRAFHEKDNKRDIAIFEILANTGLRVSELTNLEIDDVVLTERNGEYNYSYIKVREGKGGKYREVPLNTSAKIALKKYLEVRPCINSNRILIGQRGPLKRHAIDKIIKKYCKRAEIEFISPHILRHVFSTKLLKEGNVDIVTVSKLLGHSSIQVTQSFYISTTREDRFNAINKLEY